MKPGALASKKFTTKLASVLKLDLLINKTTPQIVDIWNTYHCALSERVLGC